jgi:hypothetical protein
MKYRPKDFSFVEMTKQAVAVELLWEKPPRVIKTGDPKSTKNKNPPGIRKGFFISI